MAASVSSSRSLILSQVNDIVDLSATMYNAEGFMRAVALNYQPGFGRTSLTVKGALRKLGGRHTQSTSFITWAHANAGVRLVNISALGSGTPASPDYTMICNSFPAPIDPECTDGLAVVGNSAK